MEVLPDALVQYILSYINNARDVAMCNCVSKRLKESTPCIKSLFFPRNSFEKHTGTTDNADEIIRKMVSSVDRLEELIVFTPFSSAGLASWLSVTAPTLKHLELRMDSLQDQQSSSEGPSKLDCLAAAKNVESLNLWGVLMVYSPSWDVFLNLKRLQIVGAKVEDHTLSSALKACPNLVDFSLLACEGARSVSIELPHLEECKLDFYGPGNCVLSVTSPRVKSLEIQGCSVIWVRESNCLQSLTVSNNTGRVEAVDFGNLGGLESLTIRGVQWSWNAISKVLRLASNVKSLLMKVEFAGDNRDLQPFPEVDLVDFFNGHLKLIKFEIHGAMFAALCQINSLRNVEAGFTIPCLEEVVITVRSPLNAEQKMNTLESIIKHSKSLRTMVIKILHMKSIDPSADDFFDEVCRFRHLNRNKVRIE